MASSPPKPPPQGGSAGGTMVPPFDWDDSVSLDDDDYLDKVVYAIRSAAAGTLAVTTIAGRDTTLAFTAGETRVGQFTRLRSTDTVTITADDLEVAYQY